MRAVNRERLPTIHAPTSSAQRFASAGSLSVVAITDAPAIEMSA
jgi:hypothetical protein